ncbi:sodium:solute symporter family protein [Nesterenkonia sp. HG001]|uniref:sodium:solute symporter family protein n=1 Tax=Nesterenkonia sp. HG001 TaxID=2983207 RepID=UPI002AC5B9B2|nr:sodium:solute symporter family protein [Nesterenkonia sp. HG001]MDZ5077355.1 sodium:solute symporter family protein [Nesterenkonia sp. HG001]
MNTVHVTILILYLVGLVATGLWFSRTKKVSTGDDFIFAGRQLPTIVMVGTLVATWVGSGTIIGGASFVYSYGPLASLIFFAGTPLGILVLYALARRIRVSGSYTVPQILEMRFGISVRMLAAAITILAYVGIVAYQFTGGGSIISLVTGLTPGQGAIIATLIITFLALGGGLKSVAWSDFFSAAIIVTGLLIAVPIVLGRTDGFTGWWEDLPTEATTLSGGLSALALLGYFLPTFLLIIADQNMYQRLGASRDPASARRAMAGMFFASFLIYFPVIVLATAAITLMPDAEPGDAVLGLASAGLMPTVLGGLILASALAFIITTGSSFLLSVGSNIVYDGFARFTRGGLSDRSRLLIHRITILVIAALAYVLGTFFPTVLELQMYSYTVYGVALVPPLMAAFFWRRATTAGVLSSMILGVIVTILWEQLADSELNAVIVSLPVAVIALLVVSLLTTPRAEALPDELAEPGPEIDPQKER